MIFTGDKNDNEDEFQDALAHLELICKVRNASLRNGWFELWTYCAVAVSVWLSRRVRSSRLG